jgi:hypothetical protein
MAGRWIHSPEGNDRRARPAATPISMPPRLDPVRAAACVPRDALLAASLLAALALGALGHPLLAGGLTLLSTGAYVAYLVRAPSPRLLYRPRFRHWLGVLGLWALLMILLRLAQGRPPGPLLLSFAVGLLVFHYACVCVYERAVHAVWATTIRMSENPCLWLFWTGLFVLLGIGLLVLPFLLFFGMRPTP